MYVGSRFLTKQIAEAVVKKRLLRNRLEAYAVEYMGGVYEFKFGAFNWFIYYDFAEGIWLGGFDNTTKDAGKIYMTKECKEYLCEALNSGRIVL